MDIEVRVRIVNGREVTRHYVVRGFETALCGRLTQRSPTSAESRAHRCQMCEVTLARMEGRS